MSHELEATIAAAGSKVTYTGAATTLGGYFLSNEFAYLTGIVLGVAGLIVNWYYKARKDRREQEEHAARMRGEL